MLVLGSVEDFGGQGWFGLFWRYTPECSNLRNCIDHPFPNGLLCIEVYVLALKLEFVLSLNLLRTEYSKTGRPLGPRALRALVPEILQLSAKRVKTPNLLCLDSLSPLDKSAQREPLFYIV